MWECVHQSSGLLHFVRNDGIIFRHVERKRSPPGRSPLFGALRMPPLSLQRESIPEDWRTDCNTRVILCQRLRMTFILAFPLQGRWHA